MSLVGPWRIFLFPLFGARCLLFDCRVMDPQPRMSTLSTGRAGPGPAYFYWPSALALEGRAKAAGPWPRASSTRGHGGRARVGPGPARGHPL